MGLPEASTTLPEIDADTCPQAGAAMRAAKQKRRICNDRLTKRGESGEAIVPLSREAAFLAWVPAVQFEEGLIRAALKRSLLAPR
jgi:hypothetical protein